MNRKKDIGIMIKLYRKSKSMCQKEFSKTIGVTSTTIHRWETRKCKPGNASISILSKFIPGIYNE